MRSVVDRNVVMRRVTALWHASLTSRLQTAYLVQYEHIIFQDIIYNGASTDRVRVHKSNIVWNLKDKLPYLLVFLSACWRWSAVGERTEFIEKAAHTERPTVTRLSTTSYSLFFLSLPLSSLQSMYVACSYFHYFLHKTHININIFASNNVEHKSDIPGVS